jgi:hypothetical protein
MVKKFPFIDLRQVSKGQRILAFFLTGCLAGPVRAETVLFATYEQQVSSGTLATSHWLNKRADASGQKDWLWAKSQVGAMKHQDRWTLGLTRTRSGYLHANQNALFLAAQNQRNGRVVLTDPGPLALTAQVHSLDSTVLSVQWRQPLGTQFQLSLTPHVHMVHDYQKSVGDFSWQTTDQTSRLKGSLQRVGTRDYGFLLNDQANSGWGWGLDMGLKASSRWGDVQWDVSNLWSQLRFSAVHYSNRQYDLSIRNGQDVVISDMPSLQGQYGVAHGRGALPAVWRVAIKPSLDRQATVGLMGMNADARWFAAYALPYKQHSLWFQTVQGQNWGVGWDGRLTPHWTAGLGLTGTASGHPSLTSLYVKGAW